MFEFGVVVDSSSVDRMERVEEFDSRIISEVSEYKIVGISLLDIKNTQIELDMYCEDDNASNLIGSKLKVVRLYNKARRLLSSMYCIRDFSSSINVEIDDCLPVYSEKGESLFSCNGNKFKCKCAMGLGLVVDTTSLDVHVERFHSISNEINGNILCKGRVLPLSEISCLLDTSIKSISHTNDLYYIHDNISEFILQKCCKTLMIASAIDIDKLVLNAELRTIELPNTVNIKTLYISKCINEEVMCRIIYYFVSKYMFETANITDTKYIKLFDSIGTMLKNYEYHKLWDWCYSSKDGKKLLSDALKDANIVIY